MLIPSYSGWVRGSAGWDISTAVFNQSFSISAQETISSGLAFKPDGTKMYIIGFAGDDVNEYSLSTAWDISTASYVQNFSVSSQDTFPAEVVFSTDGTKMYVAGGSGNDVNEYSLSTAWDVSTASYVRVKSTSANGTGTEGLRFKDDGTKMYVLTGSNDSLNEYSLSTAWDVSTASYVQSYSVTSQETTPTGVHFKPDGTAFFIVGFVGSDVNEYSLSTAWDISTASYVQNFSVASQEINPQGIFFKPDGTKMYVSGNDSDAVYEYDLG